MNFEASRTALDWLCNELLGVVVELSLRGHDTKNLAQAIDRVQKDWTQYARSIGNNDISRAGIEVDAYLADLNGTNGPAEFRDWLNSSNEISKKFHLVRATLMLDLGAYKHTRIAHEVARKLT